MKRTLSLLTAVALAIPFGVQAFAVASGQIAITSDADFTRIGTTAGGCECVTSGFGTPTKPYLIESLTITSTDTPGVSISGTSASFDLDHITVHVRGNAVAIKFVDVHAPLMLGVGTAVGTASITHVNIDSPPAGGGGGGIHLVRSSGVNINGDSINSVQDWGIKDEFGVNNTIQFMTVAHAGLRNPASKDTASKPVSENPFITGVQGNAPGGVLLLNTTGDHVFRNLFNEDAYANLELVNSNGNTVRDLVSRYPDYFGTVLQNSSDNMLDDLNLQTADFDGLLLRQSSNNTIINSTFSANGPIGNEWAAGVVPYFIAGAYIGWGSMGNTIKHNNGNFGNTGPDLVMDDGKIPAPSTVIQGVTVQNHNPLNNPTSGFGDWGAGPMMIPGATPTLVPGTSVIAPIPAPKLACDNSFATLYWYPSKASTGFDPNASCPS